MRMATDDSKAQSLCGSCSFVREVPGRHAQRYLLCQNPIVADKYPRQPVLVCPGYERTTRASAS
jgi:hypothetical protein